MKLLKYAVFLLPLFLCGCPDTGPVGLFSQPLYNKNVGLPSMVLSHVTVANNLGLVLQGTTVNLNVTLKNNGGSSDYGYVYADLSGMPVSDGNLWGNLSNNGTIYARAYYGSKNQEIKADGTDVTGQAGHPQSDGSVVIDASTYSFSFYCGASSGTAIPFTLTITDPFNKTWTQNFNITVN
jgi:hypothetical protein